jgi:hypothetical protein
LSITHNGYNDNLIRILIVMNKFFVFLTGEVDTSVRFGLDLLEVGALGTNDETTRVGRNSNLDSTLSI